MYSIILVDDEKSIREHLAKVIPFKEHGFEVKCTAINGKEAFEKLAEIRPDLILLDIRMPVMDGFEFLKLLRQSEYSNTQVIILSGYNEFEYAKEAMKYGVKAYLNKPVEEEEILPLLDNIRKDLDNSRLEKDKSVVREKMKLFKKLFNGGAIERKIFKGYTVMSCVLMQSTSSMKVKHPYIVLQDCLSRYLGEIDICQFRVKGSQYSFLLYPQIMEQYNYDKKLLAGKLSEELKKENLECAFLFDSYAFEHTKDTFRVDFSNHNYEMLTRLFFHGGDFMEYSPLYYKTGSELYLEAKYLEAIKQHILCLDKEEAIKDIEMLMAEVERCYTGIQYVQEISYRIYYLITDEISKITNTKNSEPFLSRPECIESLYFVSFREWKKMLCSLITEGFEFIERNIRRVNPGISKAVIEYVHMHYMKQISLKQVADLFFTNSAYLGRVFQKSTGVSFKEYVNKIRISEAKKLLVQTDKLIYEIASQVGFTESSYFTAKFTQEVGKSPTEYRNIM
ncbi:MAG: response regulator [Clostridiaceae bacterium]|nr:response regulator [Clostridiaceae bacterium]